MTFRESQVQEEETATFPIQWAAFFVLRQPESNASAQGTRLWNLNNTYTGILFTGGY